VNASSVLLSTEEGGGL